MFSAHLTDAELETLVVALKYWRHRRLKGDARRTDHLLSTDEVDILLAKLTTGIVSARPSDDPLKDLLPR